MSNPQSQAVAYLRSSKDRSDVSIDAQRRQLHDLAAARGLVIIEEFADAVESGKDEDRPGFQHLYRALRSATRGRTHVLVLDTSRIARRRAIALIFEQECGKRGVKIVYKSIPEGDPITEMLLRSILQAMDEWHSLTSKAKGLAGMAENVRQGWRAGGRAPRGYTLEYQATGAIREGAPVMKSRLVPNDEAAAVAAYLGARADGQMRARILTRLELTWQPSSLNGMEWQALTYAGHTVWNMHAEREGAKSASGTRRRPRSEWMVQRDTHPALITDAQADAILSRLEDQRAHHTRRDARPYLLTGLLVSPSGDQWAGDSGGFYRLGKGRRVAAPKVDGSIRARVFDELAADATADLILMHMRNLATDPVDGRTIAAQERKAAGLAAQIGRTVDMAAQLADPAPVLRRVAELEHQLREARTQIEALERRRREQRAAPNITRADVQRLLTGLRAAFEQSDDVTDARSMLGELIEKIVLDPETLRYEMHMRAGSAQEMGGVKMASRRVTELSPVRWVAAGQIPPGRHRAA